MTDLYLNTKTNHIATYDFLSKDMPIDSLIENGHYIKIEKLDEALKAYLGAFDYVAGHNDNAPNLIIPLSCDSYDNLNDCGIDGVKEAIENDIKHCVLVFYKCHINFQVVEIIFDAIIKYSLCDTYDERQQVKDELEENLIEYLRK